jgi:uncharacterized membrane-anchored protein YitT (DUF2179 family)
MKVKEFFKNKYILFIFHALLTVLGAFVMSIAFKVFYIPNEITPGGFSGLATIFSYLLGNIGLQISPSIIYIILNIVLFVIALLCFGFRFTFLTLIGTIGYSVFMDYNPIPPQFMEDTMLASIIGGVIYGIGCGFVFRLGSSTGGSDIVALSVNKKFPKIKPGQVNLILNCIVLLLSFIVYKNLELTLYTIIAVVVSSTVTDKILNGIKTVRAVYIICTKDEEIAKKIMNRFNQGVTRIDVEGMYSQKDKKMLLCLVSTYQAPFIKSIVTDIEPTAIVYSTSVSEAVGEKAFLKAKKQGLDLSKTKWKHLLHPKAKTKKLYTRMPHTKNTKGLKKHTLTLKRTHSTVDEIEDEDEE